MRILYLYSGIRKGRFFGKAGVDFPDTQLYGLNHIHKYGVRADVKEITGILDFWPFRGGFGFRIKHLFSFFLTRGYDVVFGSSILYALFWKKIFPTKTKFVILNTSLTRLLAVSKKNSIKLNLVKWLLKEADGIVCLTSLQKDYIERNTKYPKEKIYVVPLGVDVSYHRPNLGSRENFILSAGRDNGRDYQTVVDVARLMPEERFEIVASKRNMKGISDIPSNVAVYYDISHKELREKYRRAKIFLLTTHDDKHLDGSDCSGQTALLDAMANGMPIVVSRKKYLEDYAHDGKEVLKVDFYNSKDVREKIILMNDERLAMKLGRNARKSTLENFSTEKMAMRLSEPFKSITESGSQKNLNRLDVIQKIIDRVKAKTYLEIGVEYGTVFTRIRARKKIAVDPEFKISLRRKLAHFLNFFRSRYFEVKSDTFFERFARRIFSRALVDVAFIDGLHTYDQSLRDVQNTLKYLSPGGVIIMHDCNPKTREMERESASGDVWKTIVHLRSLYGIRAFVLDADCGLGIVVRDSSGKQLSYTPDEVKQLTYKHLEENREKLLDLKPQEYLDKFLGDLKP